MISLVYVTARGLHPIEGELAALGQYDLLAQSLQDQTYRDFEVIVVDAVNPIPRNELAWFLGDRVRFIRPRRTPWHAMGAFAPSSARNSGLAWARGEVIVSLDDLYTFGPFFFERIAALVAEGVYPVVHHRSASGDAETYPVTGPTPFPAKRRHGGLLTYPMAAAEAINGWDERFDAVRCFEDWNHFDRLRAAGVRFVEDPGVYVTSHPHRPSSAACFRCAPLAWQLAQRRVAAGNVRGNEPWTPGELADWRFCPNAYPATDNPGMACRANGGNCVVHAGSGIPCSAEALAVIESYEAAPWFDLAAERRSNGVAT